MDHLRAFMARIRPLGPGDNRGQGLAEYALILALIAIVSIAALTLLGSQISTVLSTISHSV